MNPYDAYQNQLWEIQCKEILRRIKESEERMKRLEAELSEKTNKQFVVRWKWAKQDLQGSWRELEYFFSDDEIADGFIKLEYTRTEFPK